MALAGSLFPITAVFGKPERAWYYLVGYVQYGLGVALLVYLVVAVRRLRASRAALARDAVVQERLRIDAELSRTVGAELDTAVSWLRELADYWRTGYDWRAQERKLNQIPQFVTTIEGQRIRGVCRTVRFGA